MIFSRTSHTEPAFSHLQGAASALSAPPSLRMPTTTKTRSVALQARWPVSPVLRENNDRTLKDDRPAAITDPFPARLPL